MARSDATAGKAVYRICAPDPNLSSSTNLGLRVPSKSDEGPRFVHLQVGEEVTEDQLEGLVIPSLVEGGWLEKLQEPKSKCEACQVDGTAAAKKKTYTLEELQGHYREKHLALVPPEEVTSG